MGEMFDKITAEEKQMMEFYLEEYACRSDANERETLEEILKPWEKEKAELYKMFGENLILSKSYTYQLPQNDLYDRLEYGTSWGVFTRNLHSRLNNLVRTGEITFENEDPRCWWYRDQFPYSWNRSECISNKLADPCIFIFKGKKYAFPADTKFMKLLGRLSDIAGLKEDFEKFRLEHSMVLNNAKQHGKICLSIHPLDFMTMSDNESNWQSCMSWQDYGCYRMGTVEMMNSPMVVVAYLASSTPMTIKNGEWNNKKWRQLFVINEHVITEVKPYPYIDEDLTKTCLSWLNELAGNVYSEDNFKFESGENRYLNYYRLAAQCNKMYNDFASCTHLTKIKLPVPEKREGKVIRWSFNYSGPTECMCCGKTIDDGAYFSTADTLVCDDCGADSGDYAYCTHCGCRIDFEDDEYYCDDNGEYWCCDCRDEYFTWDEYNEEYIDNDYAIPVHICSDRNKIDDFWDYHTQKIYTHQDIRFEVNDKGNKFMHQNEDGDWYVFVDEAPRKLLIAFFGTGQWGIRRIRDYVNKESYRGFEMANIDGWYYQNVPQYIPIVL